MLHDAELVAIWRHCGDDDFGRIIRLLVLTAARRSEVGGLQWGELSADLSTWTLPASRSKNKLALFLPLPPTARAILAGIKRQADRDWVFGWLSTQGFSRWSLDKRALCQSLGDAVRPWRIHDLRRSVATKMAEADLAEPHVIEAARTRSTSLASTKWAPSFCARSSKPRARATQDPQP